MSLFKLDNVIQHYSWGSKQSISELFGIQNPNAQPQAEIWMGVHPRGCSRVANTGQLLSDILSQNSKGMLGEYTQAKFGELPYLFKVLAAENPLSIQVHPSKKKAQLGFDRENKLGIPLDASNRNYKDSNHKPELVYAITPFKAMNGFRPVNQIAALFNEAGISSLNNTITEMGLQSEPDALRSIFQLILQLAGAQKDVALRELKTAYSKTNTSEILAEAIDNSRYFSQHYPDDIGLFSPFILNTIKLSPGEAMYLDTETPHAYVNGTALEIMANSDNVLRAGLTPKYIDVPELISNTQFKVKERSNLLVTPLVHHNTAKFPVPVEDFGFEVIESSPSQQCHHLRSAEILFCIDGSVTITSDEEKITITKGESAFISYSTKHYQYEGKALFARAFN